MIVSDDCGAGKEDETINHQSDVALSNSTSATDALIAVVRSFPAVVSRILPQLDCVVRQQLA